MSPPVLRLGILGTTDAVETTYLPALTSPTLQTHFHLHTIYSTDTEALQRLQKHYNIHQTTTSPNDILQSPEIDLVLNLLPFEYHEQYTVAALEAGKHVMVDLPLSLSVQGFRRVRDAKKKGTAARSHGPEGTSGPPEVFVGCARRYAPCFTDIFKKELASLDRIYYARCRNIAGPLNIPAIPIPHRPAHGADGPNGINELNGMNGSDGQAGINDLSSPRLFQNILEEIFGSDGDITPDRAAFCRFLGTLGSHDLSLMRETLGFPDAVSSVSITDPFYSAFFHYTYYSSRDGDGDEHPFTLVYEAGVDSVPRCDAHLTVYGARKTVSVEYDFPFPGEAAGKERSVKVVVEETVMPGEVKSGHDHGHGNAWDEDGNEDGAGYAVENGKRVSMNGNGDPNGNCNGNGAVRPRVKRTEYVSSCEEAYEREFLALHSHLTGEPGPEVKTTAEDALHDLRLLHMIFGHYDRQCGTIRTPLG